MKRNSAELKQVMDKLEKEAEKELGIYVPELSKRTKDRIKICDLLEMSEFALCEVTLGNRYADPIFNNTLAAVTNSLDEFEPRFDLKQKIRHYMSDLNNEFYSVTWRTK